MVYWTISHFCFDVSPYSKLASRVRRDISLLLIMEEAEGAEIKRFLHVLCFLNLTLRYDG